MLKKIGMLILIMSINEVNAQLFEGRITDAQSGAFVPFAAVYLPDVEVGVISDSTGYFRFDIALPVKCKIRVSAATYETKYLELETGQFADIQLMPRHIELEDVVVSTPHGGNVNDNAFKVDHIKIRDLNAIQASNLTEAIANINGVQQASTGNGISKPVVRGMQGNRVLTVLNGMRVENQQWGSDHGFGISQLGISAVEVIKGPSSLLFGPDAFGGVIYLIDEPYSQQNSQTIEVSSLFESVSMGTMNTLLYKASKGKFHVNAGALYANRADYMLANGNYASNTRFNETGAKFSAGYSKRNWVSHVRYMYGSSKVGIPGAHVHEEDSLATPEYELDHQERNIEAPFQNIVNHFASWENKLFMDKGEFNLLLGHTYNGLREYEEELDLPSMALYLNNSIYNFRYIGKLDAQWKLVIGAQGMRQVNRADTTLEEVLIPSYSQLDNGMYSIAYFNKGDWSVQFGARYDVRLLDVSEDSLNRTFGSPNISFGVVRSTDRSTIRFNVASGYRAPHVSELLSDGVHHSAQRYEIGDRKLVSEKALQFDISGEFHGEHLELNINPFFNYLTNYIQLLPGDSLIDGYQVFWYDQTPQAMLYGGDIALHYHPHFAHWLHFESSYSYIRGEDLDGKNFARIPQARLNNLLKIMPEMDGKVKCEEIVIQYQYYFGQDRITTYESSSKSYHVLNMSLNWVVGANEVFYFSLGVKNVLNQKYINHLSGLKQIDLSDPGRNYFVALRYTFNSGFGDK